MLKKTKTAAYIAGSAVAARAHLSMGFALAGAAGFGVKAARLAESASKSARAMGKKAPIPAFIKKVGKPAASAAIELLPVAGALAQWSKGQALSIVPAPSLRLSAGHLPLLDGIALSAEMHRSAGLEIISKARSRRLQEPSAKTASPKGPAP